MGALAAWSAGTSGVWMLAMVVRLGRWWTRAGRMKAREVGRRAVQVGRDKS